MSSVGQATCTECSPGTFTSKPGQTACEPCSAGTHAPTAGLAQCLPCPAGTYATADAAGTIECAACPASFTTAQVGSAARTACTCTAGTYWQRREDVCEPCPAKAQCAGGLDIPVTFEGYFMQLLGDTDSFQKQDAQKLQGPETFFFFSFF